MIKIFRKKETRSIPAVPKPSRLRIKLPSFVTPPLLILLFTVLCLVLLFPYHKTVQPFDLPKPGAAAEETIIAPFTFDVIRSDEELKREREKAREQVLLVMDYDPEVGRKASEKLSSIQASFNYLEKDTADSLRKVHKRLLSGELSRKAVQTLQNRPALFEEASRQLTLLMGRGVSSILLYSYTEELDNLRSQYNTIFENNRLYQKRFVTLRRGKTESTVAVSELPVKEIALEYVITKLRRERKVDNEALNALYELLSSCVRPNVRVNSRETFKRMQAAAQEVRKVSGKVLKDTEIVRKHQEVTPEIIQKLRSLHIALDRMENVQDKRKIRMGNLGRLLLALLPLLFLAYYLKKFQRPFVNKPKSLIAFSIILVFQLIIVRLGMELLPRLFEKNEMLQIIPEYLIPVSAGTILCAILFGFHLSVILGLFVSLYFSIVSGFNQYLFIYTFLVSLVSALVTYRIRYRWHFFRAIPPIFVTCILIVSIWQLVAYKFTVDLLAVNYTLTLVGVLSSIFLAMMLTPLFERVFDITTDMTLVELSDMNHPILKRLSIEAAGTYNHSVLVGNLAESAAQRIRANSLLARVAAYYHDIGKIEKSDYFVENCLGDKSRHNKLSPSMSALIISSHVKEGVELAKKYKLPKVIQDVILQHHGDSTVSFFYEKALEQDPHKQVQQKDFCYPGPVPQTRETAIIMLADSVEAASRSLASSSPKLLRELVKKIIRDKFLASQLDQCNLTLRDLNEITEGFMPVLQGIFHTRIEYPNK
ncbi:MAG: HD family phosphohydrolase [Chitinispirillaceae bacterium]